LFRSFHSLKGISGMVGLHQAEQLAHNLESYLRALRESQLTLSANGIDALMAGARTLEDVIAEFRAGTPIADIDSVMAQLAQLLPRQSSLSVGAQAVAPQPISPSMQAPSV